MSKGTRRWEGKSNARHRESHPNLVRPKFACRTKRVIKGRVASKNILVLFRELALAWCDAPLPRSETIIRTPTMTPTPAIPSSFSASHATPSRRRASSAGSPSGSYAPANLHVLQTRAVTRPGYYCAHVSGEVSTVRLRVFRPLGLTPLLGPCRPRSRAYRPRTRTAHARHTTGALTSSRAPELD